MSNHDDVSPQVITPAGAPPIPGHGAQVALFLDVDGTLVGFQHDPAAVVIDPAVLAVIRQLKAALQGALAIISGRALSDLDRMFPDLDGAMAGLHGAELRHAGEPVQILPISDTQQSHMRELVTDLARAFPLARIEDKGLSIALHVPDTSQLAALRSLAAEQPVPGYEMQPGRLVLEFKPAATNKGIAVNALLKTAPFLHRQPFYFGDDLTDENAFEAVNGIGGCSVLVGPIRATSARFHLENPADVHTWLNQFARELLSHG